MSSADTAYRSKENEALPEKHRLSSKIHFQRTASKDFNSQLQKTNAARSKVRCRVEHVFAHQKNIMGLFIRTIGMERTRIKIAMTNIAYATNGLDRETIYLGIADERTKPRKKSKD